MITIISAKTNDRALQLIIEPVEGEKSAFKEYQISKSSKSYIQKLSRDPIQLPPSG